MLVGFTPAHIVTLSVLMFLFCIELCYLYGIYDKVSRYAKKAAAGAVSYAPYLPSVSVIVYTHAYDEDAVLKLLPRLLSQRYQRYEIIVVNDGTTEELRNAVSMIEWEHKNVYQTSVPDKVYNVSGKKLGITLGVKASQNDIIVVTEANCVPVSDDWLASIARNFEPGVDVVLGYMRMAQPEGSRRELYHLADRVVFGLRYLAYAVLKRPYMGVGANMAYRKEVFFANKGFSSNLHLHYGDDDLLVNAIANKRNTRVELSPESIVESIHDDNKKAWDELRMRYNFTSKFLRTSSTRVFAFESVLHILLWVVFAAALILSAGHLLAISCAVLLFLLYWVLTWLVFRRAARYLGERCRTWMMPMYHLLRPFYAIYYAMAGKNYHRSNYTWQYLR